MNPINVLKQFFAQGLSPQNIFAKISMNNPIFANLMNMAQKGDAKSVEDFARNICKQRGVDFDTEYSRFRSNFK